MKKLRALDESKLFQQLNKAPTDDPTARGLLAGNVRWVVDHAQIISDQIIRRLPQYTLHQGAHLFNVLAIMEELLPDETLQQMTPLECALCILAAFTHDLGMVMTDEEVQKYQEARDTAECREWLRHCDAYPEELRQIERWKKIRDSDPAREAEARRRISYLEGHLLAEFIRKRHAAELGPILHWLTRLEAEAGNQSLFRYGNFNFKRYLAQIGVSHGQRVSWLREQLGQLNDFRHFVGGERVNFAFPGLLVRLADIMDFDATRAPGILYKHFGIENAVSILEWNKHIAITGWSLDDSTLTYETDQCQHPVYEKTIRKFVSDIEREVKHVREELSWQQRLLGHEDDHYQLRLPELVQARIRPACDDAGRSVYIFHDLQFELDQDEIQQLLMGESLYGDPTLCLRELLQNSLDALQMRDLRLKVLAKDPDARVEPTDLVRPREELHVKVTWGRDLQTDREYIRVWDNGCGMTRDVLERYFTKLGKSYYRSPEYERERQILREHGFIVSPISQFGIGFLSCFMLADEVHLRTHPGGKNDGERNAYDVHISGPGSLFWLSPGTLERQGTEITLYLKRPFQLDYDRERAIRWLRAYFEYSGQRDEAQKEWQAVENQKYIDPLWIMGRYAIWPLFPISLSPEGDGKQITRLNDRFHWDVLAPIDIEAVIKKATEWDFPASALGQPHWECLDWEDNQGDQATGTRIRLIFPYHQPTGDMPLPLDPPLESNLVRAHELAAFVETTLDTGKTRKRLTVKGIAVDDLKVCVEMLPAAAGVGTRLWVDLRGPAAPRLTADRKTAMPREDVEDWPSVFRSIFRRWCGWLQGPLNPYSSRLASGLLSAFSVESELRPRAPATLQLHSWQIKATHQPAEWIGQWLNTLLIQEIASTCDFGYVFAFDRALDFDSYLNLVRHCARDLVDRALALARNRDPALARAFALALNFVRALNFDRDRVRALDRDRDRALDRALTLDDALARACALALALALDRTLDRDLALVLALVLARTRALDFERVFASLKANAYVHWKLSLDLHLLPEAFADDLSRSLPPLGVCGLRGRAGDGWLMAPGWIEWDVDPVTAEVCRDSPEEQWSRYLIKKGYDLVFPLTNVPLGRLRCDCPEWRSDRSFRARGVLAYFLLGSEELFKEQSQAFLELFKVPRIHALMPKPELWLKPFDDWTATDWSTCGLSALWDIESGCVYWAEGAHSADDMPRVGKLIDEFIASATKAEQSGQNPPELE